MDGVAGTAGAGGMPIAAALEKRPLPGDFAARDAALRRLGFDELLALQIGMVARDRQRRVAVGEPVAVPPARDRAAIDVVEAALTEQVRARTGARSRPG